MINIFTLFYSMTWRDIIEILITSSIFYYITLWLSKDKKSKLLIYFYLYCALTFITFCLDLPLLFSFFTTFSPAIVVLFILFHQEKLQKNFVSPRTFTPAQISVEWYNDVLRCILVNRNKGIPLHFIIEHNDSVEGLLDSPFIVKAPFQFDLMQALISSELFSKDKLIWIKSDGTIMSINAQARRYPDLIINDEVHSLPRWQQDALILSKTTDALTISSDPAKTSVMMIAQESIASEITAEQSLKILKKHIQTVQKGTSSYEQTKSKEKSSSLS